MENINDNLLINNYWRSLKQKYNAVCFDIDGTLTKDNSKKIDDRAIEMIAKLLKKKVPVVFITGRGFTGLNHLIDDIYSKLCNTYNVEVTEMKRMYALINDGARLFYTVGNDIFDRSICISNADELGELEKFNGIIIQLKNDLLDDKCHIKYSNDDVNKRTLNVRFVLLNNNEQYVSSVMKIIYDIINKHKFEKLTITRGIYMGNTVIQVGTTKKDKAIKIAEKLIGVPENSMIRLGDCGDIIGNDYSMLNCKQGYSVNKNSGNTNGCFPIFDKNNVILKGINATLFLIENAKILPTVCLEHASRETYIKNYAEMEYNIVHGKNRYLKHYNNIINDNFNTIYGINDLFDVSSGSVKIPMYEWEILKDNNPLKQLFAVENGTSLLYALRDNFNYLLRGSKNYYYFLANRKSQYNNDYTSRENVKEWYENNLAFLYLAEKALDVEYDYSDNISKKLILGLLDNFRNILLLQINHNLNSVYFNDNLLININSSENEYMYELYRILYINDTMMANLCFDKTFEISIKELKTIVCTLNWLMKKELIKFLENNEEKDYSKEYRAYREIDNFAENYITMKLDFDKNSSKKHFGVCGTCYGGIELPIIYKIVNQSIDDVLILKFANSTSGYRNKQLVDLREFCINDYGGLLKIGKINCNNIILLDDNILTGKTMQLAINALYDNNISTDNISIVRYPSINRVNQMFMKNHGAVDYRLFFEYITGLCFCSPYSWVDRQENTSYLDSLGIFDLNREKIIECLIKNHDYSINSEVYNCKKRIKQIEH